MVRSKIRYELITDERARRETFRKRKLGIFKKLNELKALCDIEACAFVYNGDGAEPEVWPSQHEAFRVFQKFKSLPPSLQRKNMVNEEWFLKQNLKNLEKETKKVESLERELLVANCLNIDVLDVTNSTDACEMLRLLDRKIRMVNYKIANTKPSGVTLTARAQDTRNELYDGK